MNVNVLELGEAYLNALNAKDVPRIASMVHPEIKFKMPLAEVSNQHDFLAAVRRMLANARGLQIKSKFGSGNQAMFVYEINFNEPIGTVKTASLMTFEGDKIKEIELFFDARPFEKLSATPPDTRMAA